jgi:hypothetical protein
MAADPNPALRSELNAALAVLAPQIRFLHAIKAVAESPDPLAASSISPDLLVEIKAQIVVRERRRDLIKAVIANLDTVVMALQALDADGFPTLDAMVLQPELFTELSSEVSDWGAAAAVFKGADQIGLDIANVALKDQDEPA